MPSQKLPKSFSDPAQKVKWEKIRNNHKAGREQEAETKPAEPKNKGQDTLAFIKWIKPLQSQGRYPKTHRILRGILV